MGLHLGWFQPNCSWHWSAWSSSQMYNKSLGILDYEMPLWQLLQMELGSDLHLNIEIQGLLLGYLNIEVWLDSVHIPYTSPSLWSIVRELFRRSLLGLPLFRFTSNSHWLYDIVSCLGFGIRWHLIHSDYIESIIHQSEWWEIWEGCYRYRPDSPLNCLPQEKVNQ